MRNADPVSLSQEAKYFADQIGAYEVHYESGEAGNKVLKQMVPALPIGWSDHGSNGPMTLIGMREWQDVSIKVSFKLPSADAAACIGSRVDQMWNDGIVLCVDGSANYNLTVGGPTLPKAPDAPTASPAQTSYVAGVSETLVEAGTWHILELETVDDKATGALNGKPLFTNRPIRNLDT